MTIKPFSELTFTVFDIETTGFSSEYNKIVEIAAVQIKPNYTLDLKNTFSELINPEQNIPRKAYNVHKISNNMVKNKPTIDKIMPKFIDFSKDTVLVGHNINRFDMRFINKVLIEHNLTLSHIGKIDTINLSSQYLKGSAGNKLDDLIQYFNIKIDLPESYRHRALFDAAYCAVALIEFFYILDKHGINNLEDLNLTPDKK